MESYKVTAPTRVDLAGGTLDIWPLYCLTGGARTLNIAIGLHAIAHFEVAPSASFRLEIQSGPSDVFAFESPLEMEQAKRLSPALQFPVAVLSSYLSQHPSLPEKHIRIRVETEAPLRSGLGGSSALSVALVRGLSRIFDEFIEQGWQWNLLSWVKDMEAAFLTTPTGTQDYLAALFGGANTFQFDFGVIDRSPFPEDVQMGLSDRMLVLFSGEMHQSGLSNWEVFKGALEGNTEVLGGLSQIRQIADQLDAELRNGRVSWKHVGHALTEEWNIRRTAFHVETKRLEEVLGFLREQRVLGAKVCGAAQGGSLLALVDPGERDRLADLCEAKGIRVLPATCATSGVTIHPGKESARRAPVNT